MDAFGSLLDGPRARGAFLLRSVMDPPWSMRIQDEAPITVVAMLAGDAWVVHDERDPQVLRRGDVAIIRGPQPYTVADQPATAPQVVIHPGQRCATPDGASVSEAMDLGVRSWGNNAHGSMTMLVGTYQMRGEISRQLIDALPTIVTLPAFGWQSPVVALLGEEIVKDEPGQDVVLALAAATGVCRSALARRFTDLVGEPPMTFLAGWRLALAADLLRDADLTVAAIARQVGYSSPFALSAACRPRSGTVIPLAWGQARMSAVDGAAVGVLVGNRFGVRLGGEADPVQTNLAFRPHAYLALRVSFGSSGPWRRISA